MSMILVNMFYSECFGFEKYFSFVLNLLVSHNIFKNIYFTVKSYCERNFIFSSLENQWCIKLFAVKNLVNIKFFKFYSQECEEFDNWMQALQDRRMRQAQGAFSGETKIQKYQTAFKNDTFK